MGENIQREWDADPRATELWDALQLCEQDQQNSLSTLTAIAEDGSPLAMMYLGVNYSRSGIEDQAERWLRRSADAGSIKAEFNLPRISKGWARAKRPWKSTKSSHPSATPPQCSILEPCFIPASLLKRTLARPRNISSLQKRQGTCRPWVIWRGYTGKVALDCAAGSRHTGTVLRKYH